ncbi:MSMEG_4193 family putative phosphomutase [Actinocorallia sp. API 0066]|uniref:MSMEG_4193 family putative phosphomutase n=1 Tax=Actinocorallia sp. API 0066 TaxID=2896846 RepID=UPI001E62DC9F|nr:MSMEG_4193 family putative phosphomutase [Actinocorallia sp. API 0066]MCD0450144.1 MSMEG_4193 family putative phosphomutase [Actinocorallia sp. API 0066]
MPTVLLIRHGLTAQTGPVLTGWTPGVPLDERGRAQAEALAARLSGLPLDAVVSSPLDRCRETAGAVLAGRALALETDDRFGEVRYGDWTGRKLSELAEEPLWKVVQAHPSAVVFPGGEALAAAQARAVQAVREWNARLGEEAVYAVCSHGDIIKAITADALGLHLDQFQRIQVEPASLTVIRYTALRPFLARLNDTGGSVAGLVPPNPGSGDAPVGGGA